MANTLVNYYSQFKELEKAPVWNGGIEAEAEGQRPAGTGRTAHGDAYKGIRRWRKVNRYRRFAAKLDAQAAKHLAAKMQESRLLPGQTMMLFSRCLHKPFLNCPPVDLSTTPTRG